MNPFEGQINHVLRRLIQSPAFSAITLITLALGIGANTAIFSIVSSILLKPLPYREPERLVSIWETAPGLGIEELNASPSTYFTFREDGQTFEDVGLWRGDSVSVTGIAEPEQVDALFVTDGTLPILAVSPVMGRYFTRRDDSPGTPETVMLSYGYWQRRFGADRSVLGRRIIIDGRAHEIIGILPRGFRLVNASPALVLPFRLNRNEAFVGNFSFQAVARLRPGITLAQANADVARMLPIMIHKFRMAPGMNLKMLEEARLGPNVRPLKQDVVGDVGKVLWVLMATVGLVLFIACANVANLLLVRAEGRQQELAIRAALGASRTQIAAQLLFESITLGILGGFLGLGVAYAALRLLVAIGPANLPRLDEVSIDPLVLAYTIIISLLAGLLFGFIPILKYGGARVGTALREGGRTASDGRERHRARNVLVVVQVALALVLLIGSGLMIRTLQRLRRVQPGFTYPEQVLTLRVSIPQAQVADPEMVVHIDQQIAHKISAVPGVTSVGLSSSITMDGENNNDPIFVNDRSYSEGQIPPLRRFKFIAPDFFRTVGNPILAGRDITWSDIYGKRPVVLVSENFAREYWRTPAAAVGRRLRENPKAPWREIIGVVGDERDDGVNQKAPAIVYWPLIIKEFWGDPVSIRRTMAFAIRSPRTGSAGFLKEIRQAVWSVNPNVPIADVRTIREIANRSMARTSFTFVMLTIASGMALLLGLIGIYGVISYSVSQRTREIGIRMALGAQHRNVRQMFLRHGLLLACVGVAFGIAAAVPLTRLMSALLFEVSPLDPLTYSAVSLVLLIAALFACYLPTRRATLIQPADALRSE
jgi:predicted permease